MSPSVSDTTASPTPFSPFSARSYSSNSAATSDDTPDLGAFPTVFRELTAFYPPRTGRFNGYGDTTPTSTLTFYASDYDSEVVDGSTVWNQRPIASYLSSSSPEPSGTTSYTRTLDTASSTDRYTLETTSRYSDREGTEDEEDNDSLLDNDDSQDNGHSFLDDEEQPSLGFAGALDFLAAERARFVAQRDALGQKGNGSTTVDGTWRHPLANRRKRRRNRNRSARRPAPANTEDPVNGTNPSQDDTDDSSSSSLDRPSSPQYYKSTPPTPPPASERRRQRSAAPSIAQRPIVHHSKSTPSLRLPKTFPIDPRVLQLRNLAHKLRMLFPRDAESLADILSDDHPSPSEIVDPRGPTPRSQDTLIHVFIDHSNILFGFLNYIRKHTHRSQRKRERERERQLSHAALALILERGRPITRRVLVTSSPLYQPIDSAEQLGYDAKILRRVPDDGSGPDRHQSSSSGGDQPPPNSRNQNRRSFQRGHNRGPSFGGTSESEPTNGTTGSSNSTPSNGRVRYREQGVDELLQLKLHQAIADVDNVPENATIVLATGDGNVGQFNEEGFLGCVRIALKKGWKVELYSWEGSLSKAWLREFGENDHFDLQTLDRFAVDLVEL